MGEATFILSHFMFTFLSKFPYYEYELINYKYYWKTATQLFCLIFFFFTFHWKLERRCEGSELIKDSLSPRDRLLALELLYVEYVSNEESAYLYEDEEDLITGEVTKKLKGYLTKKLSWERTSLTNLKGKLDKAYRRNLTPHARAMASPGLRVMYRKGQRSTVHHDPRGRPVHNRSLGSVVKRLISTNTGTHFNHVSFLFRSKAFPHIM